MTENHNSCLSLKVAGHVLEVSIDPKYAGYIESSHRLFLTKDKGEMLLDIETENCAVNDDDSFVESAFLGQRLKILDAYSSGWFDFSLGRGNLKINLENTRRAAPSLNNFLRNIFKLSVIFKDKGLSLHGSAILKDDQVFIFIGPPNAGKTTISKLSLDYVTLDDEMVIIKPVNGDFKVFPHPEWGYRQVGPRENKPYKISSIFKLIQDKNVFIERFSSAHALADIFTFPAIPRQFITPEQMFDTFSDLIAKVPYYGLHFLPEPSFWACINELNAIK